MLASKLTTIMVKSKIILLPFYDLKTLKRSEFFRGQLSLCRCIVEKLRQISFKHIINYIMYFYNVIIYDLSKSQKKTFSTINKISILHVNTYIFKLNQLMVIGLFF